MASILITTRLCYFGTSPQQRKRYCHSAQIKLLKSCAVLAWQPSASADPSAAGSLLHIQDGKVNGIPVWVWILVGLLAVSLALIVTGNPICPFCYPADCRELSEMGT